MININWVTLRGFKQFAAEQKIEFGKQGQFCRMSGQNLVHPELGPNGTGKSSVWDGLTWALYGVTPRGLRAKSIMSWLTGEVTRVVVNFSKDGRVYTLTRTQSPNTLTITHDLIKDQDITQEKIDDLIGLSFQGWVSTTIFAQFGETFFDLTPTKKLERFVEALQLEIWSECSREAVKLVNAFSGNRNTLSEAVARIEGAISAQKVALDALEARQREIQSKADQDLKGLDTELVEFKTEETAARKALEGNTAKKNKADQRVRDLREKENAARRELDAVKSEWNLKKSNLESVKQRIELTTQELRSASQMGSNCPTCRQQVMNSHRDEMMSEIRRKMITLKQEKEQLEIDIESLRQEIAPYEEKLSIATEKVQGAVTDAANIAAATPTLSRNLEGILSDIRANDAARQRILNDQKYIAEDIKQASTALENSNKSIEGKKSELAKMDLEIQCSAEWPKRFKEIRLFVIEQALAELEAEVGNCLVELGLTGWRVKFETSKTSDRGDISMGFQTLIYPPERTDPILWEAFSGGEVGRLRIAGAIGLANLISSKTGFACNIEVWDEPTNYLSKQGIDDLLLFFSERSKLYKKEIWVIDHRSLDSGIFDREVTIVRTKDGSKIQ